MSNNLLSGSMMNVRHQPDNFMHVKKFTNLDTVHHDNNECLSGKVRHSEDSENELELDES